jgi:cytoskeletal protein CcmA (bactofilin family)
MALFRSNDDASMSKQRTPSPAPPGQVNIIGQGTIIEGGITASSDVRIAGRVIGNVRVDGKTVITPEGEVQGEVRTTHGDIAGRISGELIVEERLLMKDSARVEGNIFTKKLVIEDGATFTGTCDMSGALPAGRSEGSPGRRGAERPTSPTPAPAAEGAEGRPAATA